MRAAPRDARIIYVTAKKWSWTFSYPDQGYHSDVLWVQQGQPTRLVISSQDVVHSVYIPAFRTKMDAVPGRYTELWFTPTELGKFPIFCAEYCGTDHSRMLATVVVVEQLPDLRPPWGPPRPRDPLAYGRQKYAEAGCKTCHSLDGSPGTGPSFKNLWGSVRTLSDGTQVTATPEYLRRSIEDPAAQIVAGYAPQMPSYKGQFEDGEIRAILEFIRHQGRHRDAEKLFRQCEGCHSIDGSSSSGPTLRGVYGSRRRLSGGGEVTATRGYLLQSIENPSAELVEGYPPLMPSYEGQFSEKELQQLLDYLEALR